MSKNLGRLERVELRQVWETEDRDFTPWLAEAPNLRLLGDIIGIDLELEAQEKDVGPFRADILCKNTIDGSWVLIENQIEKTDHKHLGQLMTYAAGLEAVTIVWIASKFTEEHRSALDWLNRITEENFRFFGLEVELWKIDDSLPAPTFNIVSQPNDWNKTISQVAKSMSDDLNQTEVLQYRYWLQLKSFIEKRDPSIKTRNSWPRHWYAFSIGRSGTYLCASLNTVENKIAFELFLDSKDIFDRLYEEKDVIESEFGYSLEWRRMSDKKTSRIILFKDADPKNTDDWENQNIWFFDKLQDFNKVFKKRVQGLQS